MNTVKEIFEICNDCLWYDFSEQKNIEQINRLRRHILEYFYNSIPGERINISLSIIDDIILKPYNNETDDINKIVHKLREQILYMLSFQKKQLKMMLKIVILIKL